MMAILYAVQIALSVIAIGVSMWSWVRTERAIRWLDAHFDSAGNPR